MTRGRTFERDAHSDELAFYLQGTFRALLDAMARPGEVIHMADVSFAEDGAERLGLFPSTVAVADALLDAATDVASPEPEVARALAARTRAAVAPLDNAAFTVVPIETAEGDARAAVLAARAGELVDPHRGATLVVECATLLGPGPQGGLVGAASSSRRPSAWRLTGPGIKDGHELVCDAGAVLEARLERADEFPCGIDLVLVDAAGHVAAVPRSTHVEALECAGAIEGGLAWDM